MNKLTEVNEILKGGRGSGNFGHGGRPGKRGGSGKGTIFHKKTTDPNTGIVRMPFMESPIRLSDISNFVSKNVKELGGDFSKTSSAWVPGIWSPELKKILVHGIPTSHSDMSHAVEDMTGQSEANFLDDNYRFGFRFSNGKLKAIEFNQGAQGSDVFGKGKGAIFDEDKAMKRIFKTMDKLAATVTDIDPKTVDVIIEKFEDFSKITTTLKSTASFLNFLNCIT